MKDKIKKIAEEAGAFYASGFAEVPSEFCLVDDQIEKFARLIVEECALTLESITVPVFESVEELDKGYNKALMTGATVIKRHFGIE